MKIITDSGANLSSQEISSLDVLSVPFTLTFGGKSYLDGVDITADELYRMMEENEDLYPTTSQPSVGNFTEIYRRAGVQQGEKILSVHISSGLSGTLQSASTAAKSFPQDQITLVDTKILSRPQGWMVIAAAKAIQAGGGLEEALQAIQLLKDHLHALYTLKELRYLRHGGRIGHIRHLMASLLRIKPIIGMDVQGKYETRDQQSTFNKALQKMAELVAEPLGNQKLFVQFMHGSQLEGVKKLRSFLSQLADFVEGEVVRIPAVLGSHTGPSMVGVAAVPLEIALQTRIYSP